MNSFLKPVFVLLLISFISGCAFFSSNPCKIIPDKQIKKSYPREVLKNADWGATGETINLDFIATENLNTYQGAAHSLLVKVLLLSDRNHLRKIASTPAGIDKILSPKYGHNSILAAEEYTLYPGETQNVEIEKVDDAKYVFIVAGFSKLTPSMVTAMELFPVINTKPWYDIFASDNWQVQGLEVEAVFGSKGLRVVSRKQCTVA